MFPVSPQTQKPELHQEVLAIACPSFHRAVILYVSKMLRPQGSLGRTELHCCRRGQDMVRTWQGAGFSPHLTPVLFPPGLEMWFRKQNDYYPSHEEGVRVSLSPLSLSSSRYQGWLGIRPALGTFSTRPSS